MAYRLRTDRRWQRQRAFDEALGRCQNCERDLAALCVAVEKIDEALLWRCSGEARERFLLALRESVGHGYRPVREKEGWYRSQKWVCEVWEMDHIVPKSEGGSDHDPKNHRALCIPCHKRATAALAARRARRRSMAAGLVLLLLSTPALAAPPAPPGPLAAIAHQAAVEAAEEEIASQEPAEEAGDPLEELLWGLLAEDGEESAEDEPQDAPGETIDEGVAGEAAEGATGALVDDPASPVVAAAWCSIRTGEPQEGDVGCDVGVGAPLWRLGRFSVVGAVGSGSVAAGVAFTAYRGSGEGGGRRVVVAFALGVAAPYDEHGMDAGRLAPAVGATFGISP